MTATAREADFRTLGEIAGIKDFIQISRSPIVGNVKFVNIQRPTNQKGSGIIEGEDGNIAVEEGLLKPILVAFLENFCQDIERGIMPKISMIFSEHSDDLIGIQRYLKQRLGDNGRNNPWALIVSDTGPVTKRRMMTRTKKSQIYLYICTSVLMMGVDFPRVDNILLCRPMPHLHSLLQARGGQAA